MRAAPRRRRCDAPVPVWDHDRAGGGDAWYGPPATAGHPGAIGLPPARRSLPVPGLHQPVGRGGWRRPDRADVQPPPVPLGTRHPCRAARRRRALRRTTRHPQTQRPGETPGRTSPAHPRPDHGPRTLKYHPGSANQACPEREARVPAGHRFNIHPERSRWPASARLDSLGRRQGHRRDGLHRDILPAHGRSPSTRR